MWGHRPNCGCPICHTFPRVFQLISSEIGKPNYEGFVNFVGNQVRHLEAEVRDELTRRSACLPCSTPAAAAPPAPAAVGEEKEASQKDKEEKESDPGLQLSAKGAPPVPPPHITSSGVTSETAATKEEPSESHPTKEKEEAKSPILSSTRARSSGRRRERRSENRRRGETKSPIRREEGHKRRSKDRDRKRRRSTSSKERRSEGGKERKRRPERPPEPLYPPVDRREQSHWVPREPNYPPPAQQGRGWIGPLPRSNHPRWTSGENKGQVKRAKQELYSRRERR